MKIGIFGGTFNPPHNAHVNIARQAVKQLKLDKLLVVPCGFPPHKRCDVDKNVRLRMTTLALGDVGEVWTYEIDKPSKSYTVETLCEVKRLYPYADLYLVIGGDSLRDFDKWYKPDEVASLCTLAVAERGERTSSAAERLGARVVYLDAVPCDVSSTDIRLRYRFGMDNSDFVPPSVDGYILDNGIYGEYRAIARKLRGYLTQQRYEHTFYVVKRGLELAADCEQDKTFTACLLHDCAKYVKPTDYANYGFTKPDGMPEPVVHSFLGAEVAKRDFGVTDEEVLNAIRYHTTGRPNMSKLEKIVYVADKTEQTRPYPLRHLLTGSLDDMFLACLKEANEYRLAAHGDVDFALTDETLNYYLK